MIAIIDEWIEQFEAIAQSAADKGHDAIRVSPSATAALAREVIALRKQAALDRQSREASQVEFARLNRELNEAKERIQVLLDEIAGTAIAAGMMDPGQRGAIDGPNVIQFLRLMKEQHERK